VLKRYTMRTSITAGNQLTDVQTVGRVLLGFYAVVAVTAAAPNNATFDGGATSVGDFLDVPVGSEIFVPPVISAAGTSRIELQLFEGGF
jgi:hypothetical protein